MSHMMVSGSKIYMHNEQAKSSGPVHYVCFTVKSFVFNDFSKSPRHIDCLICDRLNFTLALARAIY
jgi:hypothetical protein